MTISASGKLSIKKRPLPQWLTYFIFVMPFFLAFLQAFLRLPGIVKYTIDIAWILVIALLFIRQKVTLNKRIIPFIIFTSIFLIYTALVYIFHFQSVFYYLWGMRNNFRFYFTFIAYCMLFTENDANTCLKFIDILFYINVVVSLFQFFVLGYKWDYLGGIFGTETGCNAYSLIFFTIVVSKSILEYLKREEKLWVCIIKCGLSLILSAMAELKFFFIIFAIILLMVAISTSFTWRKLFLFLIVGVLISFAGSILTSLFGESSTITWEKIMDLTFAENYSSQEDLSRLSAIPTISTSVMNNATQQMFGLGLGNCDTSSFAICNTPFFMAYSRLHYNWFSSAFIFLEMGYTGLAIYLMFFVMTFICSFNMRNKEQYNNTFCVMSMIMSVVCIILTFYNSSLRTEAAYMAYFVLALPLISSNNTLYKRRLNIHT